MALRCNEAFAYTLPDGSPRMLTVGQLVEANDPAVKKCPDRFSDADDYLKAEKHRAAGLVEQATAAPGEKRSRGKAKPAPEPVADEAPADAEEVQP